MMHGPQSTVCDATHQEKYRNDKEDFRESMNRVASALQDNNEHFHAFRDALLNMRFLPGGRIQAAMGSLKNVTPYNCFVMPTIHDSFVDGPEDPEDDSVSIMETAKLAARTMRQGGGVGYDFSTLRPSGDFIKGVQAHTDGPLAFAPILDAVCSATSSAGNRRGAQMMVMRCDHPDIESFIHAKNCDPAVPYHLRPLRGFNMSVGVTDELMRCVETGESFPLRFGGQIYRHVDARALWEMIMRSTYDWAEPGVIFIDRVNKMNNLRYCELIAATNPCGEQPLPPYGACLLGSINLVKYVKEILIGGETKFYFDFNQLEKDIPHIVRAMDNVVDRAQYPLEEQKREAQNKRRMGIGVTGLANAIEAIGHKYGDQEFVEMQDNILAFITNALYSESALLASEKGSFPLYDEDRYLESEFIKGLDNETYSLIVENGIRNSHLTSIAPTGTISFCADNVSSGIEPVFGYSQKRRVITKEGEKIYEVNDYGYEHFGVEGRKAEDVTAEQHVLVLCTAQKWMDSSVSKTCNVPSDYPYEDFKRLYRMAFEGGAKGCTTFRPNGNYEAVISSADPQKEDNEACGFDPLTGMRTGNCAD